MPLMCGHNTATYKNNAIFKSIGYHNNNYHSVLSDQRILGLVIYCNIVLSRTALQRKLKTTSPPYYSQSPFSKGASTNFAVKLTALKVDTCAYFSVKTA